MELLQGTAQVSLADFRPESVSVKWYNILSYQCLRPPAEASGSAKDNKQMAAVKEESSDESTIISSQTSTLTRNQGMYPRGEGMYKRADIMKIRKRYDNSYQ